MLWGLRAEPTEQAVFNGTEEPLGFFVYHTDVLLRAVDVGSSGPSGKGSQVLEYDVGFEIWLL